MRRARRNWPPWGNQFTREWRMIKDTKKSGAGTADVCRPSWSYFEQLRCWPQSRQWLGLQHQNLVSLCSPYLNKLCIGNFISIWKRVCVSVHMQHIRTNIVTTEEAVCVCVCLRGRMHAQSSCSGVLRIEIKQANDQSMKSMHNLWVNEEMLTAEQAQSMKSMHNLWVNEEMLTAEQAHTHTHTHTHTSLNKQTLDIFFYYYLFSRTLFMYM